jgi:hypothetical protein
MEANRRMSKNGLLVAMASALLAGAAGVSAVDDGAGIRTTGRYWDGLRQPGHLGEQAKAEMIAARINQGVGISIEGSHWAAFRQSDYPVRLAGAEIETAQVNRGAGISTEGTYWVAFQQPGYLEALANAEIDSVRVVAFDTMAQGWYVG